MRATRAYLLATVLAAASAACSDFHGEFELSPPPVGSTQQAYCLTHTIVNVTVAPGTYHWEDPGHLLNATEGFGPQQLGLVITTSLASSSSSSSSYTPQESEISTAVGYDVSEATLLSASTSVLVPFGGYKRAEAYAAYKKSTWDLLDTNCGGPDVLTVSAGSSLKPVGIYFKVCSAYDCSLGGGQVGGDPLPSGPIGGSTSSTSTSGSGGGASGGGGNGGAGGV
jgi:hypothetical protein